MLTTTIAGSGTTTISGAGKASTIAARPWLLFLGDSKTFRGTWALQLRTVSFPPAWTEINLGIDGSSVCGALSQSATIAAILAPAIVIPDTPTVLINLGVNDYPAYTTDAYGATWRTAYLVIIDAIRARWSNAPIYITKPWMVGNDAKADLMAGWVDTLVTQRTNLFVGPDERIYYKGADNGATNTSDGVHPSVPVGEQAVITAWKAVLGWA